MASMSDLFEEDAEAYDEGDIYFVPQEARLEFIISQAKKPSIRQDNMVPVETD